MSTTAPRYDVIIAGAGLTGSTLALALLKSGAGVVMVDPDPAGEPCAPDGDLRASAVSPSSVALWRALGLGDALEPHLHPIRGMSVLDAKHPSASRTRALTGMLSFEPDGSGGAEDVLGYMVPNGALRRVLGTALRDAGLEVRAGERAAGVEVDSAGVEVLLTGGGRLRGAVVVGAEGRRSRVREAAGVRTFGWGYGQTGIVATLELERDLEGVAHQIFLPGGPLAVLPLPGARASLVWSVRGEVAADLLSAAPEAFEAHLARRFGEALGRPRLLGPVQAFPLSLQLAERLIGPRTALVGEAGHVIHPVAGQGLNLGLKDVAALAEVLTEARRVGEDPGSDLVLERYARWRRFDAAALALATDAFTRVFSTDAGPVRLVRDAGLALVARSAPLRRAFAREAAGRSGDVPRLLRGESL